MSRSGRSTCRHGGVGRSITQYGTTADLILGYAPHFEDLEDLDTSRTAPRLVPGDPSFPWRESRVRPRALREDRILHEIHATGGDVRRIYDLFGLSVESATRYLKTVSTPTWERGPAWHPAMTVSLRTARRGPRVVATSSHHG